MGSELPLLKLAAGYLRFTLLSHLLLYVIEIAHDKRKNNVRSRARTLALPLISCVTLAKSLSLSEP